MRLIRALWYAKIMLIIAVAAKAAPADSYWLVDYDRAFDKAKASSKPLLISFTGSDWCLWCKKLDRELFETDVFTKSFGYLVIPVQLDFPQRRQLPARTQRQNNRLKARFSVENFPTVILYDPIAERELWRHSYFEITPEAYLEILRIATRLKPESLDLDALSDEK